jgi:hypothetical protein
MKLTTKTTKIVTAILASTLATGVFAKGGTAKPPVKGAAGPFVVPTLPNPAFSAATTNIHGFDETGFMQNASVNNTGCPTANSHYWGGTVTINRQVITVPCNMVIQLPANTMTWADMVNSGGSLNGYELNVVGNVVGANNIAGLMYISQESLYSDSGVITKINYANGSLEIDGNSSVTVQINDPVITDPTDPAVGTGRFSAGQSPDPRLTVDQANPTIHAATGYPMCIPRTDPAVADDPLCPKKNRPLVAAAGGCRNFSVAGVAPLPASGELSPPAAGQVYCSQFVMKAPFGTPPSATLPAANIALASDPDARQQAPFKVGDYITYSGSRIGGIVSAHTIEANLGIYTQPKTQPSYLAIGEFGVGTADPLATAISGVPQETQDRIFLETSTTDVQTPVDIFMVDVGADGVEHNRWISMFEMTGECSTAAALAPACLGSDGGITTQNTGPQPQRARIRATKAITGILSQPSRNIRVMARSIPCMPANLRGTLDAVGHSAALDACFNSLTPTANGLIAGEYTAPVFEYIFPEGTKPGDLVVPNDLWHLPFLVNGEGNGSGSSLPGDGPRALVPTPW